MAWRWNIKIPDIFTKKSCSIYLAITWIGLSNDLLFEKKIIKIYHKNKILNILRNVEIAQSKYKNIEIRRM